MTDAHKVDRPGDRARYLKRFGFWTVGGLLGLLSLLMVFQRAAEFFDARAYPAPGAFYDLGDVTLHMSCQGDGPVTVLFSSGMGNPAASWRPLERLLEMDYKVCSYDRDGLGWSGDSARPRDAVLAADRLARLLDKAQIKGPLILVGHSYGALVARVFVAAHADRVDGLVMLDSSHEDMGERFPSIAQEGFRDLLAGFQLAPWLNAIALPRLLGLFAPAIDGLEGEDQARSLALLNSIHHMSGTAEEAAGWGRSAAAARAVRENGFGSLPLDVFVAGDWPEEMMPSWLAMQEELSKLSSRASFRVLEEANHPQIGMDARYIGLVAQAIREQAEMLTRSP